MRSVLIGRVECGLTRWQRKDQPAMACIHGLEPENVPEEDAVRFSIFTVNNDVSARDYLPLPELPVTLLVELSPLNSPCPTARAR